MTTTAIILGVLLGWLTRFQINNLFWRGVALLVTRPKVRDWLIMRALKTPYTHIKSADGSSTYMYRWWLFNPYPFGNQAEGGDGYWSWLPSIRIHQIMRPDMDRHLHDHPWNARTIILDGWYQELRPPFENDGWPAFEKGCLAICSANNSTEDVLGFYHRTAGYTGTLKFNEYHRISQVASGGVFTLFITYKYRGTWGFSVDGKKVPYKEYLGVNDNEAASADKVTT